MKKQSKRALGTGRGLSLGKAIAMGLILGSAVGLSSAASAGPTYPTGDWTSDIIVNTTGAAVGVSADNNSTNTVYGYNNIMVTGDTAADGVKVTSGGTATIVMNGDLKAVTGTNTKKDDVNSMTDGVSAKDGSVNITGVKSISGETAGAGDAYGINVDNSTIKVYQADGSSAVPVTAVNTGSGNAFGIFAHNNSNIENIGDVTAAANSGSAYGVDLGAGTNSLKTVNNIKATTTSGAFAVGLMSRPLGAASNNTLTVAGNVEAANNGSGEADGISNTDPGVLETKVGGNILAKSADGNATAVASTSSGNTTVTVTGTTTAEAPDGLASITSNGGSATVALNANGAMNATGQVGEGAVAYSSGTTTINGNGNTMTLKGTYNSMAVSAGNGATVNLNKVTVDVQAPDKNTYSIHACGTGANVNLSGTTIASSTSTNNAADIVYDNSYSTPGQDLNVNIDSASSLTGAANLVDVMGTPDAANDSASLGAIKITNAGLWNITGDSNLNSTGAGSLTNTGTVDMTKDGTTASSIVSSTLKLKSLTNNGNIIMDVSPNNKQPGDQIVTTDASGNGTIKANIPASELNAAGTDYLEASANPLITVTGTDTSNYTVSNNGTNRLEVGNWTYSLQKYTYKDANGNDVTGYRLTNNALLSNKGATAVSALVSPDYWYDETNALYINLNNFTAARKNHDLWAHAVHSKLTIKDRDVAVANGADLDTKYDGVVFGYDKKISQTKKGTFWAGVMAGYGRGNSDFSEGDADTDSAHIGVYGVYRTSSDWYLGGIVKYNHYKTDVDSYTTAGSVSSVHTSDNLSQNGWGLSIMGGKRFHNSKGWFVEPQLEFGFHRIGEGAYDLGAEHVNVDAVTSKRLRAGIGFGKSLLYKNGSSLDVFAQASLVHEFGADNTVTTSNSLSSSGNADRFDVDYGGTWGQYKLGVNYNTVKGDNAIFALTYNKGGHRSSPLGFEVTYNWTF